MMNSDFDFCIHDIVRVRLIGANKAEIKAVANQLGPLRTAVRGDPDIVLRFVDRMPDDSSLRILGNWEAGYTNDCFWLLRGKHGSRIAIQYPFETIGSRCEIICHRPVQHIPLLQAIVNLTILGKGFLPLHASAFLHEGNEVLVTGWAKGGKTEALLGFAERGATYVGDEWVHLSGDGQRMFGIPHPIHAWDWHLDSPVTRDRLTRRQRWKLVSTRIAHTLSRAHVLRTFVGSKTALRLREWMYGRRHVQLTPHQIFGENIQTSVRCPERIFFMANHAAPDTLLEPVPIEEIMQRMAVSLEDEFAELIAAYRQFRFAFPDRRNELLDQLPRVFEERLQEVLRGKTGYAVWHPYPVSPHTLFEVMYEHTHPNRPYRAGRNGEEHDCSTTRYGAAVTGEVHLHGHQR